MDDVIDGLAESAATILILLFSATLIIFFAILFVLGLGIFRYLWTRQAEDKAAPLAPTRMFGAPATVRWLAAYDYWLYRLEQASGIEFTTTPARLMAGSLTVSIGSAFVIGLPMVLFGASSGRAGFGMLVGTGLIVGVLTGWKLAGPAAGWFEFSREIDDSADDEELGGLILGEEDS